MGMSGCGCVRMCEGVGVQVEGMREHVGICM